MPSSLWRQPPHFLVGGHRGASAGFPENTLAAVAGAFEAGADFVETDLRLTRDGVPVAAHDATLERLTGDTRAVGDLDLVEARRGLPGLMTVAEAIAAARGRGGVLLDTKETDPNRVAAAAALLKDDLADGSVIFGPRTIEASEAVLGVVPGCPVLGLYRDYGDYGRLAALGGIWARLWQPDVTTEAVAGLHDLGLRVLVMAGVPTHGGVGWIEAGAVDSLIAAGCDGVMLNDPALALKRRAIVA